MAERITKKFLDQLAPEVAMPEHSNRGRKKKIIPELDQFVKAWKFIKPGTARRVPTSGVYPDTQEGRAGIAALRHHVDKYMEAAGYKKGFDYETFTAQDRTLAIKRISAKVNEENQ